jgi:hypothetical protein
MAHLRGAVELAVGVPATACALLVDGARPILGSDPQGAVEMLVLAAQAALAANQLDRIVDEIGPAISSLPGPRDIRVERVAQSLIEAELVRRPSAAAAEPGDRPSLPRPDHPGRRG